MRFRTAGLVMVSLLAGFACATEVDGDPNAEGGDDDGKYDDLDDIDESACDLDDGTARNLVQFVLNDHVQFRCRGPSGFVHTGCCKQQIEEFTFSTGCPLQAKFESVDDATAASGKRQRCVADTPDASEDIGITELVATSCCQLLCDEAKWDDPATKDSCRGSDGRFAPHACCEMNDDDGCGDAVWESRPQDEGLVRCWATSGDFADKYATNACCMDQCFLDDSDRVAEPGSYPLECLLPTDDECAGATVTGEGACQLDLTADQRQDVGEHVGDWGKAMCCAGQDGLDIDLADECHRRDIFGGDLSICG